MDILHLHLRKITLLGSGGTSILYLIFINIVTIPPSHHHSTATVRLRIEVPVESSDEVHAGEKYVLGC
ncbi:hypothetical protein BDV36DRAFT_261070 [Aspergillus pseudocaelatus]|uniref:Uncharacterized protein n=1 Tax=Aspergillus pseudocaelatus TaxID=1825620 RepID=A0ABQ6WG74_9EURO|nr:hypothetical protein BDV36DRAFT_261070 [Aspergillus pseudocaelatus]